MRKGKNGVTEFMCVKTHKRHVVGGVETLFKIHFELSSWAVGAHANSGANERNIYISVFSQLKYLDKRFMILIFKIIFGFYIQSKVLHFHCINVIKFLWSMPFIQHLSHFKMCWYNLRIIDVFSFWFSELICCHFISKFRMLAGTNSL